MKLSPFRRTSRRARDERGQAAIELLLALPVFIVFVLLVIDFGVLMFEYVTVSNAAREGARYGAVNCNTGACDETLICDRTVDRSDGILAAADITVRWDDHSDPANSDNNDKGDSVVVSVTHQYDFLFVPLVHLNVVSAADMRLEQRDSTLTLPTADTVCT